MFGGRSRHPGGHAGWTPLTVRCITAERGCGCSGFLCSDPGWLGAAILLFRTKAVLACQSQDLPTALLTRQGTFPAHSLRLRPSRAGHVL